MKKTAITLILALIVTASIAQTKTKYPLITRQYTKLDSELLKLGDKVYLIPTDKNINLLYALLQAGYQGVASSPHFSKDQADDYQKSILHLDSILRPQIIKFHPDTSKKVKK
jgi:hypothetical protein